MNWNWGWGFVCYPGPVSPLMLLLLRIWLCDCTGLGSHPSAHSLIPACAGVRRGWLFLPWVGLLPKNLALNFLTKGNGDWKRLLWCWEPRRARGTGPFCFACVLETLFSFLWHRSIASPWGARDWERPILARPWGTGPEWDFYWQFNTEVTRLKINLLSHVPMKMQVCRRSLVLSGTPDPLPTRIISLALGRMTHDTGCLKYSIFNIHG